MYGFFTKASGSFDEVVDKTTEALKTEGFGVLTEINVKETMKKKLDKDMKQYKILGACNPNYAFQSISAEPDIGLLLPCNVIVREEEDGKITVGFMDPKAVLGLVKDDRVEVLGNEVREKLERVKNLLN